MTEKEYGKLTAEMVPPSPILKNCGNAFWIGGSICLLGQVLTVLWKKAGLPADDAALAASMTLIGCAALLTGLGLYDNLGKRGGAGTLVPVTGFSNAVSSAAIEFRTEGFITGLGAKMFIVAGPVIVYGTAASVVYGFLYWLVTR